MQSNVYLVLAGLTLAPPAHLAAAAPARTASLATAEAKIDRLVNELG